MKLPPSVIIGGVPVKFKFDKDLNEWGLFDGDRWEITLSSRLLDKECHRKIQDIVHHEMTHAALYVSGLAFCKKHEDEAVVRCMEYIFKPAWSRLSKQMKWSRVNSSVS